MFKLIILPGFFALFFFLFLQAIKIFAPEVVDAPWTAPIGIFADIVATGGLGLMLHNVGWI